MRAASEAKIWRATSIISVRRVDPPPASSSMRNLMVLPPSTSGMKMPLRARTGSAAPRNRCTAARTRSPRMRAAFPVMSVKATGTK